MQIAIVDDEKVFQRELEQTLHHWNTKRLELTLHTFYTGEEIVKQFREERRSFDIVFMDMQLEGMDGLEASRILRTLGYKGAIVFTTSHSSFDLAQKGYEVFALHYLIKPITTAHIELCMRMLNPDTRFHYTYNATDTYVSYQEIVYFESSRNYIRLFTLDAQEPPHQYRGNIASVLQQTPRHFVQCHRSFIVNLSHVIMIEGKSIYMRNYPKQPIPIAESYLPAVLSAFAKL